MYNNRKVIATFIPNKDNIFDCLDLIKNALNHTIKPDFIYISLQIGVFVNGYQDVPSELLTLSRKNPIVKVFFGDIFPQDSGDVVRGLDEFCQLSNELFESEQTLDMTMISVFYDAGINELRKVATRKAVSHWIEQKTLPKDMMFIELGFNGVFTFTRDDFPSEIDYIRIDGNDSNKYLFQKEHLWNIAANRAKYEKLMFVDSDIAPLKDVDWFKDVFNALDKCLFTQGFKSITYLDENDNETSIVKQSYTFGILDSIAITAKACVPGGVYCINKSTLERMGYFNFLPFGGGDNLFWSEFYGMVHPNCCIRICKRDWVANTIYQLSQSIGKTILGMVCTDICHFFHGTQRGRSHTQRHFMHLTQFPLNNRVVSIDNNALLCWIDTNNNFYNVMSQLSIVNDDKNISAKLIGYEFDYLSFVEQVKKLQSKNNIDLDRLSLIRTIIELQKKYTNQVKIYE